MGVATAFGQRMKGFGLFERCQILSLDVFNECDLDNLVVVDLTNDDRDVAEPDLDGCLVSALAGDDLETATTLADDDRLDDAFLGNGRHQLRQIAHDLAGLIWIRIELVDWDEAADR